LVGVVPPNIAIPGFAARILDVELITRFYVSGFAKRGVSENEREEMPGWFFDGDLPDFRGECRPSGLPQPCAGGSVV
jgi:hypothetical protein